MAPKTNLSHCGLLAAWHELESGMVGIEWQEEPESTQCEGCGVKLPSALDGCPYCSDSDESEESSDPFSTTCPHCGSDVYEDAEQCSACGAYMTPFWGQTARRSRSNVVVMVLVLALLILILRGLF